MASRDLSPLYLTDAQQAQLLMPAPELESSLAANYTPAQIQQELIAQQANQQMQPQGYAEGGVIQRFADGGVLNMPLTGAIQPNIPAASTPAPTVAPAPTISPNAPYTWNPGSTVQNNTTYPTGTVGNYQTMGPTISSTTPYSWSPGGASQPSNASVIPADNLQALLRTIFPVADPAHYGYGPQTAQVQYHRRGGPIVDSVHAVVLDQGQLEDQISHDSSIMSRFDLEKPPPLPKRKPPVPSPFAGAGDPQESDDAGFVPGHAKGGPICIHDAVNHYAKGGHVQPTEAQKHAGNYQKHHIKLYGLNIAIENPAGSERKGKDKNGDEWSVKMPVHYGYIKRTEGADGDHVDAFVGPDGHSKHVHVIDQHHAETGKFDEHKVMMGFSHGGAALHAYQQSFSDGKGHQRIGCVTPMHVDEFKSWLRDGNTKKALANQKVQRLARGGSVMSRFKAPVKQQNFVPKLPHYRDAGLDDGTLSALRSSFRSTIG